MQNKITVPVTLLSLFLISFAFADNSSIQYKDFKVDAQTIHVSVPQGWEAMHDFLNVPISLVSEKGLQDQRAVIQIFPYGVKDENNTFTKVKKDPEEFFAQKEEWLGKIGGESISYLPFQETTHDGSTVYSIGIKYKSPAGEFLDETYYVSSKTKQLYFIKSVTPLDMLKEHQTQVSEVVNTLSSKN
jgi:hypothetical protein